MVFATHAAIKTEPATKKPSACAWNISENSREEELAEIAGVEVARTGSISCHVSQNPLKSFWQTNIFEPWFQGGRYSDGEKPQKPRPNALKKDEGTTGNPSVLLIE